MGRTCRSRCPQASSPVAGVRPWCPGGPGDVLTTDITGMPGVASGCMQPAVPTASAPVARLYTICGVPVKLGAADADATGSTHGAVPLPGQRQRPAPHAAELVQAARWYAVWTSAAKPFRGGLDDGPQAPGLHSAGADDAYARYVDFLDAVYHPWQARAAAPVLPAAS